MIKGTVLRWENKWHLLVIEQSENDYDRMHVNAHYILPTDWIVKDCWEYFDAIVEAIRRGQLPREHLVSPAL